MKTTMMMTKWRVMGIIIIITITTVIVMKNPTLRMIITTRT